MLILHENQKRIQKTLQIISNRTWNHQKILQEKVKISLCINKRHKQKHNQKINSLNKIKQKG